MKKQALLTTALVALVAPPIFSQSTADSKGTFTIAPSYVSDFMFRGMRLGGPSFQPTVEYSKGPLTVGVWSNFPISKKIEGVSDPEFDIYASWDWQLVPDALTIRPGITAYTFPRAENKDGFYQATYEPNLSLVYSVCDIDFTGTVYYDLVMKGPTYEFGIDYSVPIKPLGIGLELSALAGSYDWSESEKSTEKIEASGKYWQAGISIPYEFSDNSRIVAGWYYAEGKEKNSDAFGRGVFNISFSYSF
ncbi:MAG: hypothetical protein FWG12_01485 [Holophagaceae bacterium]|nr:hypothetical protein [Holophagaceae bacterium]